MKTAEQFLEECKAKWGLNTPENAKQAMIAALILYAEQAIDECAQTFKWEWDCDDFYDAVEIVDPDTITEVKNMLK